MSSSAMTCRKRSCASRSSGCGDKSMSREHWLRLAMTEGIGPILIRRLIDACGSAEAACIASATTVRNIDGIGNVKAQSIAASMRSANVDEELRKCDQLGVR